MTGSDVVLPVDKLRAKIHIKCSVTRNVLSEFFGTMMLLFLGLSIVMQFILSHEKLNTWIQINVGWGFAITFCVLMTSKTSGDLFCKMIVYICCVYLSVGLVTMQTGFNTMSSARTPPKCLGGHLNPAVSLLMVTMGHLSFVNFILYSIAQTLGAIVGSFLAYMLYLDQFNHFVGSLRLVSDNMGRATAACFCSFPAAYVSNTTAFYDQVVGTAFLCLFVCAVIDKRNKVPDFLHPLFFGLILIMIGCAAGMNLGYPINPARDLGPRIFAFFIYGSEVFWYHNYYFWIPIVAPLFGAVIGGWSYQFFVGVHIEDPKEKEEESRCSEQQMKLLKGEEQA